MGNSPSLYEETNWDEVNGGLTSSSETLDGSEPTPKHVKIHILPSVALPIVGQQLPVVGQIHAAREYEVRAAGDGDGGAILFTTKKVGALESGFDLIGEDGTTVLLRVFSTFSNRTWQICKVGTPAFEGQHALPESEKAGEQLYRKAAVIFEKGGAEHSAVVHMFGGVDSGDVGTNDVDTVLRVERCSGGVTAKWHFQTMLPGKESDDITSPKEQQPLVAYWKWESPSKIPLSGDDRIAMDLASGSDLALHVVLAVLSTIERASWKAEYSG